LGDFPVEVNTASYDALLRVPGIGPKGVMRIMSARKYSSVNFQMLKKMGIVLKRAQYFITCNGRMMFNIPMEERFILSQLADVEQTSERKLLIRNDDQNAQMDLFSDFNLTTGVV
jgi:predicted DNA-binding helix-hairpin-helix protein